MEKWQEENIRKQKEADEAIPEIIGTTIDAAREYANEKNLSHRVRSIDGRACIGTCDLA